MKTLKNIGKLQVIDKIQDGAGKRIAKDFLRQLLEEFSRCSFRHIDFFDYGIAPFAYREKQVHSVIAPAISKITKNAFLMECPVNREWSKKEKKLEDNAGWLDYWCRYREFDFFIELKHSYFKYGKSVRKDTKEKWGQSVEQLDLLGSEAEAYSKDCKGVITIALEVVTIFDTLKDYKDIPNHKIDIMLEMQKQCFDSLNPAPNWSGLWMLHKDLTKKTRFEFETSIEIFPGVILIAKAD